MSIKLKVDADVFQAGLQRTREIYQSNNRVIVAFSGGKDSGVLLELARIASKEIRNQPVEVFVLDDEIMYPGTFEYQERIAQQPDISMNWLYACEPMPCVWNRESPYWWVFDWTLDPEQWVRKPPSFSKRIIDIDLYSMVNPINFPPPVGEKLMILIGNRASESRVRLMSIHSSQSFITKPNKVAFGSYKVYPIYDWRTPDIWRAISTHRWDYNTAYDVLNKMGLPMEKQRIAPPTMAYFGMNSLAIAAAAWPQWYDRVNTRLPGAKTVAKFGMRAVQPLRRSSESWEDCFQRECVDNSPKWISSRSEQARTYLLSQHANHASTPFPEVTPCKICGTDYGSWQALAEHAFTGDPYSLKLHFLPYVQPATFRPSDTRVFELNPQGFR